MTVGDRVTLRDSDDPRQLWDVVRVGEPVDVGSIDRGWDNDI